MLRGIRANDYFLLGIAIFAIPVGLGLLGAFSVARDAAASLDGDPAALDAVGMLLAGAWLFTVGFHVFTGAGKEGDVENEAGMLTIRPPKDVAGGQLLVWTAYYGAFVLLPGLAGSLGIALATGSPLPPLGILAATLVVATTAAAVGFPAGLAVKGVLRRSSWLHRLKPVIGLVVGILYFWLMFTGRWIGALEAIDPVLEGPPLGWIGDLALLTTPGAEASLAGAVGALAVAAAIVPIGALATARAAAYAWSADRDHPEPDHDAEGADASEFPLAPILDAVCRAPGTRGVAEVVLVRAYRRPMQLLYALWPLLLAIPMVDQLLVAGSLPWYAPWFAILVGAWIAGETVPLNVLGNQGAMLSTLLTSPADGRSVVHGHVVAVALPLAPLTAGLAVGAGALAGQSIPELATLAVAGVAAVCASTVLAAGLGAAFPSFESFSVGRSTEITMPSKRAFAGFSFAIGLTTTGAAFALDETARLVGSVLLSEYVPLLEPTPGQLEWVGLALLAAVAVAVPTAYVVAVRRIDGFRLD